MKLPATLLQTLAAAVASIGAAGCGSVNSNEPPTETPAPTVSEPNAQNKPQENPQNCPPGKTGDGNRPGYDCPGCGLG